MIISISKGSNYKRFIEYHDQKCAEGKAKLLYQNTFTSSSDAKSFIRELDEHFMAFDKTGLRNKVAHIAISLPKGENLTNAKFIQIAQDYLVKMGYNDCLKLIYRHYDKDQHHIHILVPTIDNSGKKVVEFNDFKRSQTISRELEKEYQLRFTEYISGARSQSQTEINYRKYYLHNAIRKASVAYNSKQHIQSFFTDSEKKLLLSKKSYSQQDIYQLIGKERFDSIYNYLQKNGYFKSLFKDELTNKLDPILSQCDSFEKYIEECSKNGIYVRKMTDKNHRPYLKYGLIAENFYVKDTNLSGRFRFINIQEKFGLTEEKPENRESIKKEPIVKSEKDKESREKSINHNKNNSYDITPLHPPTINNISPHKSPEEFIDLTSKKKKRKRGLTR